MAAKRKDIDRVGLEKEYRAGIKSLRALSKEFGLAASRITQIAEEEGWARDLSAKIKAKAAEKLNTSILNSKQNDVQDKAKKASEKELVDANAQVQADIVIAHRIDIPKKRELVAKLFAEIEVQTDGMELLEQLALALESGDQAKLAEMARKVASLPSRIKGVADLVGAYKSLVGMEREAFGISRDVDPAESIADLVNAARRRVGR